MKKYLYTLVFACLTGLVACSTTERSDIKTAHLEKETWANMPSLNSNTWLAGASPWLAGSLQTPNELATRAVHVGYFDELDVTGPILIQLDTHRVTQTVHVFGEKSLAAKVNIAATDNALSIEAAKSSSPSTPIIIRLNGSDLKHITTHGGARIEGKNLRNKELTLANQGSGDILLLGKVNITKIQTSSKGKTSVLGVYSPNLSVSSTGSGAIRLDGKIGISHINNTKTSDITLLGVNSDSLTIDSKGPGNIRLKGYANLKELHYTGAGNINFYWVNSQSLTVHGDGTGHIGLAGATKELNVILKGNTIFSGKYLKANSVNVKTSGHAHANVQAKQQLFAGAEEHSSIYYFGHPHKKSLHRTDAGIISKVST